MQWIKRFIVFNGKCHPEEMGVEEVSQFLTWLATKKKVAAFPQNQAFCALLFLYKEVLKKILVGWMMLKGLKDPLDCRLCLPVRRSKPF